MRVADLVLDRAVLVPVLLVGPGPGTEQRVGLVVVPRRVPELGAVAAREREQPLVEVRRRLVRRRRERVVALSHELDRSAVADEHGKYRDDCDDRERSGERQPCGPRRRHAALCEPEARSGEPRQNREQQDPDREPMTVVRCVRERRVEPRERLLVRGDQNRDPRRHREHDGVHEQLEPARVDRDGDCQADRAGDPGAAAEREVERREEDRQRRGRKGSGDDASASGRRSRGRAGRPSPRRRRARSSTSAAPRGGRRRPGRTRRGAPGTASSGARSPTRARSPSASPTAGAGRTRGAGPRSGRRGRPRRRARGALRGRSPAGLLLQRSASHVQTPNPVSPPSETRARRLGRTTLPSDERRRDEHECEQRPPRPRGREVAAACERDQQRGRAPRRRTRRAHRRDGAHAARLRSTQPGPHLGQSVVGFPAAEPATAQTWHFGQYQVPRPPARVFSIAWPQRKHGSPSRP